MSIPAREWFESWAGLPVRPGEDVASAATRFRADVEHRASAGRLMVRPSALAVLRREPWDCDRLQLEAGKLDCLVVKSEGHGAALLGEALDEARSAGYAHLCARVDSRDRLASWVLQRAGFYLADTVVTLVLELPAKGLEAQPGIRFATGADLEAIAQLSADAFTDREQTFNRYLNDPHLPIERVRDVYATWARTSLGGAGADTALVAEVDGQLAGFLTLARLRGKGMRVPLNAVAPQFRGRGLYRALVVAGAREALGMGAMRLEIVTQLQQLAVQRTWWRLGAAGVSSALTWHAWLVRS